MKKIMTILLIAAIALHSSLFTTYVAATAPEISAGEQREYLVEKGFPEDYIESLIDEQVNTLFVSAYGDDKVFDGIETVILETQDNPQSSLLRGTIPASELELTITRTLTLTSVGGVNYIASVNVVVTYNWLDLPYIRKNDGISVNWASNLFSYSANSFIAHDYAQLYGSSWFTTQTLTQTSALSQGGLGYGAALFDLNGGESVNISGFKGDASFTLNNAILIRPAPLPNPPALTTAINVEYVHDKSLIGSSISFSYAGVGVTISPNSTSVDRAAVATNIFYMS